MKSLIKYPSAWIPIALSLIVVVAWIISFATVGAPKSEPDEGTAAHLFQIWLVTEVLMVGFFLVKWLPQRRKEAFLILAIQVVAVLAVCAPVFYFHL